MRIAKHLTEATKHRIHSCHSIFEICAKFKLKMFSKVITSVFQERLMSSLNNKKLSQDVVQSFLLLSVSQYFRNQKLEIELDSTNVR